MTHNFFSFRNYLPVSWQKIQGICDFFIYVRRKLIKKWKIICSELLGKQTQLFHLSLVLLAEIKIDKYIFLYLRIIIVLLF